MRIAIPVRDGQVCPTLSACEGIRFYEDDHGRIHKSDFAPMTAQSAEAAVALLEKYSADVLVCGAPTDSELREVMLSGILLSLGYTGEAEHAALAYLQKTVVFDEKNTCNACGHGHACSISCGGCRVKPD